MKHNFLGKMKYFGVGFFAAILCLGTVSMASAPGTDGDPLVTLGYVEKRFEEFNAYITLKIEEAVSDQSTTAGTSDTSSKFVVVHAQAGDRIYLEDSTEFILRSGDGIAIVSDQGGLSDLTSGVDIGGNESIPKNHHLLIPRDDGRGVLFSTEAYTMIKGGYRVESAQ
ncbi:MAG: hypothetical protein JXO44_01655 [Clostridia bacterium]|nr:hypothetical protein [Clostridia bacterium]